MYTDKIHIDIKTKQFSNAIERYQTMPWYARIETIQGILVMILQAWTTWTMLHTYYFSGTMVIVLTVMISFFSTDFVNGLAHMYMDNNANYDSLAGPYVANFHFHHARPRYQEKSWYAVYYTESRHKFWLLTYLLALTVIQQMATLPPNFNLGLVLFGVLSSVAEVSHYWCHNSSKDNRVLSWLQQYSILLSFNHHKQHHQQDNKNYAFLNGMSDPLLNLIAQYVYHGYKNNCDMHVAQHIKNNCW